MISSIIEAAQREPLPAGVAAQLQQVSTATLTSVLLKLGLRNTFMTDVHPLQPGMRLVGQAFTLRYIPSREDLDYNLVFDNLTADGATTDDVLRWQLPHVRATEGEAIGGCRRCA